MVDLVLNVQRPNRLVSLYVPLGSIQPEMVICGGNSAIIRPQVAYFLFILLHIHKPFSTIVTLVGHTLSIHQFQQLFSPLLSESAVLKPLAGYSSGRKPRYLVS